MFVSSNWAPARQTRISVHVNVSMQRCRVCAFLQFCDPHSVIRQGKVVANCAIRSDRALSKPLYRSNAMPKLNGAAHSARPILAID